MKNRGFTLIELLAVLIILALIALITIPAVTNSLKSYKNNIYNTQINNIEAAAKVWGSDHLFILPNYESSTNTVVYSKDATYPDKYSKLTITLENLQNEGYIDKEIKNTRTQKPFDNSMKIVIYKKGNKIIYNVIDQKYPKYEVGDKLSVNVGSSKYDFYVIEDSGEDEENLKLLLSGSISSASQVNYSEVQNTLVGLKDSWSNAELIRLITVEEYNDAMKVMNNDETASKTWIYSMNYWTNTENDSNVYTVLTDSTIVSKLKTNSYYIRPVIEISKDYVVNNME